MDAPFELRREKVGTAGQLPSYVTINMPICRIEARRCGVVDPRGANRVRKRRRRESEGRS